MRALAITALACLLTACGSVPDTYHSLRPEISITPTRQGTPTALRYTELPPYYDSEYLVWYDEHGRITRDKSQHWTYPFSENLRDVAITRVEQLYPFPYAEAEAELAKYPNAAELLWAQEEPKNQGAWYQTVHRLERLAKGRKVLFAGRPASASPAVGYGSLHTKQLKQLVEDAFAPR